MRGRLERRLGSGQECVRDPGESGPGERRCRQRAGSRGEAWGLGGGVKQLTGQRSREGALGQREQPVQKPRGGSMFLGGVAKEASEEGNDGYRHPLQDLEEAEKGIGV